MPPPVELPHALWVLRLGLACVPPHEDGSKRPEGAWKQYTNRLPTEGEITAWYEHGRAGIGIVCGQVSGNIEMLEFEALAVTEEMVGAWVNAVAEAGHEDALARVMAGYTEVTPSGGIHLLYYVRGEAVGGNQKLAMGADGLVRIETRGEGGFAITSPSAGAVHPSGNAWRLRSGSLASVTTITPDERQAFLKCAHALDQTPERSEPERLPSPVPAPGEMRRFGSPTDSWMDEAVASFNEAHTWPEILEGWVQVRTDAEGITYWCRPGKNPADGHSATTNAKGTDRLICFSSSVPQLEPASGTGFATSYDRFGVWCAFRFGGDRLAAAQAWRPPTPSRTLAAGLPGAEAGEEGQNVVRARGGYAGGGAFLFDPPAIPPAVWGSGEQVWWAEGESCLIVGPPGVGKTTLCGQLIRARLGLVDHVLGWPVARCSRKILLLAMDRPRQIGRSMRRQFTETERTEVNAGLIVWQGPPLQDLAQHPYLLAQMAMEVGADTVIIDSLKDAAVKLSDDETGSFLNRAMQMALAEGVEVLGLHHQRKGRDGAKPRTLEDVYGSTWITAGAGSVILLWGEAGDPVVEMVHLKQPAEELGPLKILHRDGLSRVAEQFDPLAFLRHRAEAGATAVEAARAMTSHHDVSTNDREKARRMLERLVRDGLAWVERGVGGGSSGGTANRYRAGSER